MISREQHLDSPNFVAAFAGSPTEKEATRVGGFTELTDLLGPLTHVWMRQKLRNVSIMFLFHYGCWAHFCCLFNVFYFDGIDG